MLPRKNDFRRAPRGYKLPPGFYEEFGDVPFCWQNLKTIYGRRPAAARWLDLASEHMIKAGFMRGVTDPTISFNKDTGELFRLHTDDFEGVGPSGALRQTTDLLAKTRMLKSAPPSSRLDPLTSTRAQQKIS